MGSDPAAEHAPDPDEAPAHRVPCRAFRIGRTPVTNAQYRLFVERPAIRRRRTGRGGAIPPGREPHPSRTSPGTTRRRSAAGPAASCRARPSGSARRAATTAAPGRGATRRRRPSTPSSRPPDTAPVGLAPARARARSARSTSPATRGSGRRARSGRTPTRRATVGRTRARPSRASSAAAPSSTARARSAAPTGTGCCPGVVDHYVGFRLAARPAAPRSRSTRRLVDVPAGDVLLGNDPRPSGGPALGRRGAAAHGVRRGRACSRTTPVTNAQYRAFVARRAIRLRRTGPAASMPEELARASRSRYVDWHDALALLPLGRRAPADRGRVGEGRARHRRPLYPGATTSRAPPSRTSGAGRSTVRPPTLERIPTAGARTVCSTWPGTSGSGSAAPTRRIRTTRDGASCAARSTRVLRGGSFANPTLGNLRCAARSRSAPGAARRTSAFGRRRSATCYDEHERFVT